METLKADDVELAVGSTSATRSVASAQTYELPNDHTMEDAVSTFVRVQPRLFGIAYRMLANVAEAEDIVQEVWLRWQKAERTVVRDAAAFLATTTTRLAINRAKSASLRREMYVGTWLPDPVDTSDDASVGAERGEALEVAVLMLLENLTPTERAAYVLREAFNYEYAQIAEIVRIREDNCRQLVARARKHIAEGRRKQVGPAEQRRLLDAFISAAQQGDFAALESLLAADVVSYSDGGGLVRAARRPVVGRQHVARFIAALAPNYWKGVTLEPLEANGQASMLISCGVGGNLLTIHVSEEGIERLFWMMRPSKLTTFKRPNALRTEVRGGAD